VTNQSVVGRGLVDEEGLEAIHERMRGLFAEHGQHLEAIYHCPHLPEDGCTCRKPGTLLVERAAHDLDFDPRESIVVGDHAGDMELGRRVGATTIFVLTGHGPEERQRAAPFTDHVADDLAGAAAIIRTLL
jgi:D-glycero-D-manno-heptose 1,7-bisphosphate phosphatase